MAEPRLASLSSLVLHIWVSIHRRQRKFIFIQSASLRQAAEEGSGQREEEKHPQIRQCSRLENPGLLSGNRRTTFPLFPVLPSLWKNFPSLATRAPPLVRTQHDVCKRKQVHRLGPKIRAKPTKFSKENYFISVP